MALAAPFQKELHKALVDMGTVYNACYKCKSQVSFFATEGLMDGKVVCYYLAVGCEKCKERGPESTVIAEATALWMGKHKLLTGGVNGKRG